MYTIQILIWKNDFRTYVNFLLLIPISKRAKFKVLILSGNLTVLLINWVILCKIFHFFSCIAYIVYKVRM